MKQQHRDRFIAPLAALAIALFVLAEVSFRLNAWLVALVAGAGTYIITIQLVGWWRERGEFAYREPNEAEIRDQYDRVKQYADSLGPIRPGMLEAATFLLDEAKGDFERVDNGSDSHEEKARAILGVVAGATSALGIFGIARDGKPIVPTPIVFDSLIFVLIAFICLLYVLRVKRYKRPDVKTYLSGAMVSEDLRVALALSLAPGYAQMTAELAHRIRQEPRALFISYVATVIAAVLVLLNAVASSTETPKGRARTASSQLWSPSPTAPTAASFPKAPPRGTPTRP